VVGEVVTAPVPLRGQDFPIPSHSSVLYRGWNELRDLTLEFLGQGLDRPEQALFLFGQPKTGERLLRELEALAGRDLSADYRARRIVQGVSDPDVGQQIENLIGPLEAFRAEGFSLIRLVGIVAWNAPDFPFPEDFLWFESKVTELIAEFPVIVLCPYDVAQMPPQAIAYGALETHPFVVSGGTLRRNPQFIPPDRYLEERLLRLPWLQGEKSH
jgi:hypothetical protein